MVLKLVSEDYFPEPHNKCQRLINYRNFPILNNYFEIEPLNGLILARLVGGAIFDRDRGEKFFDIHVDVEDNYQGNGNTNTNNTMVKLVLLDVNDNAPELPSASRFKMSLSENSDVVSEPKMPLNLCNLEICNSRMLWSKPL